jgi:hypothetical protein
MVLITIVNRLYKPTYIWGHPHCRVCQNLTWPCLILRHAAVEIHRTMIPGALAKCKMIPTDYGRSATKIQISSWSFIGFIQGSYGI